jgi:hypothetical protein
LAFILQVIEYEAFAIGYRKFGPAAQVNRARNFSICSVDRSCAVASTVKGKNPRGGRVIDDRVGIFPYRNLLHNLERFQIKAQDLRGFAITDETPAKLGSNGNSMHSRGRYAAQDFA